MSFPQLKTCRVSFYVGNGVSIDAIVTGPFSNDADARREAVDRMLKELKNLSTALLMDSKPSIVEQMLGGAK